ncbi:MAG: MBL fold metallo-hydrolase, partial [Cellulosilyticum sp.]|nr:MBL fold metallo-hydrolase [Cellulosilyticum sp.]
MKVYSLIENVPYGLDDQYEHGLSLYIETNNHKILFDTGQTGAFIENAKRLGVKLEEINLVVLSHGHYDHTGGLQAFLKVNSQAPIYLSTYAFGEHYNAMNKYIGMDLSIQISNRLIFVEDYLK